MRRLLCANYSQCDQTHINNDHHLIIGHYLPINLKELIARMEALEVYHILTFMILLLYCQS